MLAIPASFDAFPSGIVKEDEAERWQAWDKKTCQTVITKETWLVRLDGEDAPRQALSAHTSHEKVQIGLSALGGVPARVEVAQLFSGGRAINGKTVTHVWPDIMGESTLFVANDDQQEGQIRLSIRSLRFSSEIELEVAPVIDGAALMEAAKWRNGAQFLRQHRRADADADPAAAEEEDAEENSLLGLSHPPEGDTEEFFDFASVPHVRRVLEAAGQLTGGTTVRLKAAATLLGALQDRAAGPEGQVDGSTATCLEEINSRLEKGASPGERRMRSLVGGGFGPTGATAVGSVVRRLYLPSAEPPGSSGGRASAGGGAGGRGGGQEPGRAQTAPRADAAGAGPAERGRTAGGRKRRRPKSDSFSESGDSSPSDSQSEDDSVQEVPRARGEDRRSRGGRAERRRRDDDGEERGSDGRAVGSGGITSLGSVRRLYSLTPRGADMLDAARTIFGDDLVQKHLGLGPPSSTASEAAQRARYEQALGMLDERVGRDWSGEGRPASLEDLEVRVQVAAMRLHALAHSATAPAPARRAPAGEGEGSGDGDGDGNGKRKRRPRRSRSRSRSSSDDSSREGRELSDAEELQSATRRTIDHLTHHRRDVQAARAAYDSTKMVRVAVDSVLDGETKGELVRALMSGGAKGGNSHKRTRSLPADVRDLRAALRREIADALDRKVRDSSRGDARLSAETAMALARQLQVGAPRLKDFATAILKSHGAVAKGSARELRLTWGLFAAGQRALAHALGQEHGSLDGIETEIGEVPADKVELPADKLSEYITRVLDDYARGVTDFRQGGRKPALRRAVEEQHEWLQRAYNRAEVQSAASKRAPPTKPATPRTTKPQQRHAQPRQPQPADGGERKVLWPDRPTVAGDKLDAFRTFHKGDERFKSVCFEHCIMSRGCKRQDCKLQHPNALPKGWAAEAKTRLGVCPTPQ